MLSMSFAPFLHRMVTTVKRVGVNIYFATIKFAKMRQNLEYLIGHNKNIISLSDVIILTSIEN
jgi:hypothetical protein